MSAPGRRGEKAGKGLGGLWRGERKSYYIVVRNGRPIEWAVTAIWSV